MIDSIIVAITEVIIKLFLKHSLVYINRQLTNSHKYLRILIGKIDGKKLITIAIVHHKDELYVEILLHNTAKTIDRILNYYLDNPQSVSKLEQIIKPIYVSVSHPDLFELIEEYIIQSKN
jgi:hypothetical protein